MQWVMHIKCNISFILIMIDVILLILRRRQARDMLAMTKNNSFSLLAELSSLLAELNNVPFKNIAWTWH